MSQDRTIYVTRYDMERLEKLLAGTSAWGEEDKAFLKDLRHELDRAVVVDPREIPTDVVTMNSRVHLSDLDTGQDLVVQVVFPKDADLASGRISVLAPIGTALIGYRAGDTVEWKVPGGVRRLEIESVLYQPEAAGDYLL